MKPIGNLRYAGGGGKTGQFYTPAFTWQPDPEEEPNLLVFNSPTFTAPNPYVATVLGHLAEISGYTEVFELGWDQQWALITPTSGPFLFARFAGNEDTTPQMKIAIIHGPLLDRAVEQRTERATGIQVAETDCT